MARFLAGPAGACAIIVVVDHSPSDAEASLNDLTRAIAILAFLIAFVETHKC